MGPETFWYIELQSEIITKVIFDFPLHLPLRDVIQRGVLLNFLVIQHCTSHRSCHPKKFLRVYFS